MSIADERASGNIQRASDLLVAVSAGAEVHKAKIMNLAFSASEELMIMAQEQESLWVTDVEKGSETLNEDEYKRKFTTLDPTLEEIIRLITTERPCNLIADHVSDQIQTNERRLKGEASRAVGFVFRDPIYLVKVFMDVEKWSVIFSNIVSNAVNLGVLLSRGEENLNGLLQLMVAEFQVPSPLVKTREMYFVRFSRQIDDTTWIVADVSLENVFPNPLRTCQRKPSGCIIQALQDGISKVTWVEHNAVGEGMDHGLFRVFLSSNSAFSAKRWVSSLERQTDRMATLEAENQSPELSINNGSGTGAARSNLLKLAERMVRHFCCNVRSDSENTWMPLTVPGADEILAKTSSNIDDHGILRGVAVTIATSVWIPLSPIDVFNFLGDEHNRSKWDILSSGLEIRDIIRVSSARNSTDSVSVACTELPIGQTVMTYLQENFSDSTASYVVYAPVDVPSMQHVLTGGDVDSVAILPSGFVVMSANGMNSGNNTILTIAFEVMDEEQKTPEYLSPQSVRTAYRIMKETLARIQNTLFLQKL